LGGAKPPRVGIIGKGLITQQVALALGESYSNLPTGRDWLSVNHGSSVLLARIFAGTNVVLAVTARAFVSSTY
jgi:hypothetical protein